MVYLQNESFAEPENALKTQYTRLLTKRASSRTTRERRGYVGASFKHQSTVVGRIRRNPSNETEDQYEEG